MSNLDKAKGALLEKEIEKADAKEEEKDNTEDDYDEEEDDEYNDEEYEHLPAWCMIKGCTFEAHYWIDTTVGFVEKKVPTKTPSTFYLCESHRDVLQNEDGEYHHIRLDTGEITNIEIGTYCCNEECNECNN